MVSEPSHASTHLQTCLEIINAECIIINIDFVDAKCANKIKSLVSVVVNFVHNSNATKLVIEELIDSLNTYYPGLKAIVGIPNTLDLASNFTDVQVTKFDIS